MSRNSAPLHTISIIHSISHGKGKKMKIGVTQIILGGMSLNDTLALCQDADYDAVELTFSEGQDTDINMSDIELRGIAAKCEDAGIEISSITAGYADRGNLLSLDATQREKGAVSLARGLEVAGALGVGGILLHPGQLTVEGTYQQVWDNLVGVLKDLAPSAETHQVAIGLENVWNKFLLSPKEMRDIVDEIDSDWVGTYLDTANMMAYGYPEHWIRELAHRIKRVHFKDFSRGAHQFVNLLDGDTDWQAVMEAFRAIGYDGYVIHEVGGDRDAQIDLAKRMREIVAM
ncbi:xylulose 5-phosphate 3-epimerase [Candidatus Poribacteria bacterium]|nr:MAG: xylulose 5-phosphate 3-epimerase [Candidatus Poribacteria bacterium]